MASLYTKTKLYLEANSKTWDRTKVSLQDDMVDGVSSPYIKTWDYDIAKPTAEQIASYETAGNTLETNNTVIATRKTAYGSWESQLEEIYDDGIDAWKTRIAKVKSDNPKSE